MRPILIPVAAISTLLLSSAAQGQQALPLPPESHIGIIYESSLGRMEQPRAELRIQVAELAQAALRRYGYEVLPRQDVLSALLDTGVDCEHGVQECDAGVVLAALSLDAVALVSLWEANEGVDLAIEITTPSARGRASARLPEDPNALVPSLVTEALADLQRGGAVELQIRTLPRGAEVTFDGAILGTSPVGTQALPGRHEVVLQKPGYVTTSIEVEIPRGGPNPYVVHGSLKEASRPAPTNATVVEASPPVADYVLASALLAAGPPLVVGSLLSLRDGCDDNVNLEGHCDRRTFGLQSGMLLGGGVLAFALGSYLLIETPIHGSVSTDGDLVHATLSGSF